MATRQIYLGFILLQYTPDISQSRIYRGRMLDPITGINPEAV